MINNISRDDRTIRVVIGLWFISMVFIGPETQWGWAGLIPLLTAVVGFCPLYTKLGFDTKKAAGEIEEIVETPDQADGKEAGAA